MNGCVGGALPGEGRAAERSITAPGRGARLLRSPPPPTLAPPGARSSASLGLWGRCGGGPGTGARRGRPSAAGEPEVRSRLEAPAPLFFVWAWSSAVSGPRPAFAGSPRRALLGCSRIDLGLLEPDTGMRWTALLGGGNVLCGNCGRLHRHNTFVKYFKL